MGGGWNPPGGGGNWKFGGRPPGGGKGRPPGGGKGIPLGRGGTPPGKGGIGIPRPPGAMGFIRTYLGENGVRRATYEESCLEGENLACQTVVVEHLQGKEGTEAS